MALISEIVTFKDIFSCFLLHTILTCLVRSLNSWRYYSKNFWDERFVKRVRRICRGDCAKSGRFVPRNRIEADICIRYARAGVRLKVRRWGIRASRVGSDWALEHLNTSWEEMRGEQWTEVTRSWCCVIAVLGARPRFVAGNEMRPWRAHSPFRNPSCGPTTHRFPSQDARLLRRRII